MYLPVHTLYCTCTLHNYITAGNRSSSRVASGSESQVAGECSWEGLDKRVDSSPRQIGRINEKKLRHLSYLISLITTYDTYVTREKKIEEYLFLSCCPPPLPSPPMLLSFSHHIPHVWLDLSCIRIDSRSFRHDVETVQRPAPPSLRSQNKKGKVTDRLPKQRQDK